MRMVCLFPFLCGVLCSSPVRAEPPLLLPDLLDAVERRSPQLLSAQAQARAAAERPAQARAFEDPMLMVELWQVPLDLGQVPVMVTLRQPIPWPGKLAARAAALQPEAARARSLARATARELRLQAARAYYDYRLAFRAIAVLRESQELLRAIADSVDARYRVGRAELAELLRAKADLATLDNTVLDFERQRELAAGAINVLLGEPAERPLGPPGSAPEPAEAGPGLSALTERALRQRPELQAARMAIQAARARLREAHAGRAPDLAAWAGFMAMTRGGEHTFTLGLQSSIPSFSRARTSAAAREAQAQAAAEEAALRQAEARVRGEVRAASLQLETARRHLELHGRC